MISIEIDVPMVSCHDYITDLLIYYWSEFVIEGLILIDYHPITKPIIP